MASHRPRPSSSSSQWKLGARKTNHNAANNDLHNYSSQQVPPQTTFQAQKQSSHGQDYFKSILYEKQQQQQQRHQQQGAGSTSGLTDIIDNAFDHLGNNKIKYPSVLSSNLIASAPHSGSAGSTSSSFSANNNSGPIRRMRSSGGPGSFDGDHMASTSSVIQEDDDEMDGKSRYMHEQQQQQQQQQHAFQDFDANASIFASFAGTGSGGGKSSSHTSSLRRRRTESIKRKISKLISRRWIKILCFFGLFSMIGLSLKRATQNLKYYQQKRKVGSVFRGDSHDDHNDLSSIHNNDVASANDSSIDKNKRKKMRGPLSKLQQMRDKILKKQMDETNAIIEKGPHVNLVLQPADAYGDTYLAEVTDPIRATDIPLFWHIPRAGGSTLREVVTQCFGMTIASGLGKVPGDMSAVDSIRVLDVPVANNPNITTHYINLDMYQVDGLVKAKELGLTSSGLVDVISTSFITDASKNLFSLDHRGRMFTLLRHPIERAVSTFHYVQNTVWRRNHNDLADITIEEYFKSGSGENNWVTRFLTGVTNRALTNDDLFMAKEILRRKCVVGLLKEKAESFRRFEYMFGQINPQKWKINDETQDFCHEKLLHWAWPHKHTHPLVEENSDVWKSILKQNEFDMQLYEFAETLFKYQGTHMFKT